MNVIAVTNRCEIELRESISEPPDTNHRFTFFSFLFFFVVSIKTHVIIHINLDSAFYTVILSLDASKSEIEVDGNLKE